MRRFSFTVLLAAICLLPVGIGSGASAHSHAVAALEGALANTASAQAQVLEGYFSRARSIDLLTANNPAFRDFYELPGSRSAKVRRGGQVLEETNEALGYLEELFPDSIGEACFIDRAGPENARVVRGVRATVADLSPDESGAPFFAPTFALAHEQVYQARPYVSPDTGEWVISNSTLMPAPDGAKRAIVHFEVTIESFRKVAASLGSRFEILVVDARTGRVVIDSRRPQRVGAPLGSPGDRRFQPVVQAGAAGGSSSVGDRPLAYRRLEGQAHNANDWYVVAAAHGPVGPLYGVSGWSVALVVVALALLVFAAVSFLAQHRLLVATSMTDALTGIPNRRKLKADVEQGLKQASTARPLLLMLFDLNGFKGYNDSFGHPAGDALLIRLAKALDAAMRSHDASAYRSAGTSSASWPPSTPTPPPRSWPRPARRSASTGVGSPSPPPMGPSCCPRRPVTPPRRCAWSTSACTPRRPAPGAPLTARAATCCSGRWRNATRSWPSGTRPWPGWPRRSGSGCGCRTRTRPSAGAAELHDIGKLAIPEELLRKPGPLDAEEWAFVRRHPVIGERIIAAAPALAPAARLVHATHERFDGSGYPDGLVGEQIPLGARIIAACDAFTAMTYPRAYAPQLTVPAAVAELRGCAGSLFDPAVVDALANLVIGLPWPPERPAPGDSVLDRPPGPRGQALNPSIALMRRRLNPSGFSIMRKWPTRA